MKTQNIQPYQSSMVTLLLPGWATSTEILKPYIKSEDMRCLENINIHHIIKEIQHLNDADKAFQFVSFSMGGFVVHDYLKSIRQKDPELKPLKNCQGWHAFGLRPSYPFKDVENVRRSLLSNPAAFLKTFFENEGKDCHVSPFKDYIEDFNLEALLTGLQFLGASNLESTVLKSLPFPCYFYQGLRDRIAPFREMKTFLNGIKNAYLIPLKGGHFSFQNV